jgi:predicted DNA-binding protein with PD1-like motif
MKKTVLLLFFMQLLLIAEAQEKYPKVLAIPTEFKQTVLIRIQSGEDMLESLKFAVQEKSIKNGVILSGIGSVSEYHYHVVSDKNLPPAEEFPKASVPMDLTSVQGYILNQRVHAHITLSDENSMVGGHLEPGTKALTFIIITIGVLPDDLDIENFDNYKY